MIKSVDEMQKQADALNAMLTSSLPLNLLLGFSMKYLWGMINALHFVIYMDLWKVNWPANARLAIKTVRTIALLEFINWAAIREKVLDYFGLGQTSAELELTNDTIETEEVKIRRLETI